MSCVFCDIVNDEAPATIVGEWYDTIAFLPLNPVNNGHTLFVPRIHVEHALEDPLVAAVTMQRAAEWAGDRWRYANIITSAGAPATQSIFHLHIHVIPRFYNDWLMVPWGTAGNPHDPHWCKVAQDLKDELDRKENT